MALTPLDLYKLKVIPYESTKKSSAPYVHHVRAPMRQNKSWDVFRFINITARQIKAHV